MSLLPIFPIAFVKSREKQKDFRKIKFESELDLEFGERIAQTAYGQNLLNCIQCGTCSATCPMSHYMDYTPRKVIAMIREGFKNDVMDSQTIWLCASCYSCTVQCPRQIQITDVLYALKREAIKSGRHNKHLAIPVLSEEFFNCVYHNGRNDEGTVLVKMFLRTNPFNMFKQAMMGIKLFLKGRMTILGEKIKDIDKLQRILGPKTTK